MRKPRQRGFSLLELMIVLLVLTIIMGAVFQQVNLVQQRATAEQSKLDIFQQAREFMDQMGRDLKQAGYPNTRNYASAGATDTTQTPPLVAAVSGPNDINDAVGMVRLTPTELWFEADIDGTGEVQSIRYYLDSATTGGCPCIKRSQVRKHPGGPIAGQPLADFQTEVQGVQNGTTGNPIFIGYDATGAPVASADIDTSPQLIGRIKSVQVLMAVQAAAPDLRTGQRPIVNLTQTIRLNNCSAAQTCSVVGGSLVCVPTGDPAMSCNQ